MIEYLASLGTILEGKTLISAIPMATILCILAAYTAWSEEQSAPTEKNNKKPTKKTVIKTFYAMLLLAATLVLSIEISKHLKEGNISQTRSILTLTIPIIFYISIFFLHNKYSKWKVNKNKENLPKKHIELPYTIRLSFQAIVMLLAAFSALSLTMNVVRNIFE